MSSSPSKPSRNPILWAAYLACSWTWCIGMFLPIILMRDMGWPGFLIFAIPNVIGATAMGWIIKSRAASTRFVEKHSSVIWWFSAITIAFHVFWILWIGNIVRGTLQMSSAAYGLSICFALLFALTLTFARKRTTHLALGLILFSLTVLFFSINSDELKDANAILLSSAQKSLDCFWMLPVMIFGFLLCPYLDITFHYARQELDSEKNGKTGFTLGFVGIFSFMIILTTRYASIIGNAMHGSYIQIKPWLITIIWIHMLCQSLFTVYVHINRMLTLPHKKAAIPIVMIPFPIIAGLFARKLPAYAGLTGGEIIYRLFMSAYGLIFPTYLLYRAIKRKKVLYMCMAILISTPMFWLGFIERQTIWLVPGMIVIIVGMVSKKPSNA